MSFCILPRVDRSRRLVEAAPADEMARSVQTLLRPSRSGVGIATLRATVAQRQHAQVDGSDVGARDRSRLLSGVPALYYRCAVENRAGVAAAAPVDSRTRRAAHFRRHELSQAGPRVGWRRTSILRGPWEDRELPGRDDRCAVD